MKFLTICALVATSNAAEIAANGKITTIGDTCAVPATNMPCKGTDNSFYCTLNTKVVGNVIDGDIKVHADYPTGVTCKTALDGQLKITQNACATGSYECKTTGTIKTICVKPNTNPWNQKDVALTSIHGIVVPRIRTPNIIGGCFGIGDGEVIDTAKGQVCSSSSNTALTRPCKVTDPNAPNTATKIVCVKYAATGTAAAKANTVVKSTGAADLWKSPNVYGGCWGITEGIVIDTTKKEVCGDATDGTTKLARVCTVNNAGGTNPQKICVKYNAATTAKKSTATGITGTYTAYLTPNANGGCWNVADNAVIDSTKNEVCNTGSVECLLKDPTANSSTTSKQCVASTNALAKATNGVIGGSVNPTYKTPAVQNGCFSSPDYAVYKTNLICNTGSVKCALRNKTTVATVINACVPFSAAAAVTGYEYLTTTSASMSTVNNYLALAKVGGCFGVAKYEPTLVGGKEQGVCDTGYSACRMVKPDGTRAGMCVPTGSPIRGALVGATAAGAATGKGYYYPASGCFTVDDYATIATGQSCLRFGSKTCKVSSAATPAVVASICVPPSFAGKKQKVASGAAKDSTAPDVTGGCWSVINWKAAGMFETCQTAGSLKCALTKSTFPDQTFCVPKTFTDKAKAVDVTKEPFKTELATDANGYSSPAGGCFPSSGAAQLLAGAAAATTAFLALY